MRRAASEAPNPASGARANRLLRGRLLVVLFLVLLVAGAASAQTNVYTIRGNAGGNNNIWSVNLSTGVETLVLSGYPGGNAASLAQRPSDGMLFYAINVATNGAVYRFNPATPNIAPVAIGNLGPSTGGVNVSGGFRMAFNGNTLYYMVGNTGGVDSDTVYTLDQNTGQATKVATVTGTNNGGDIAFLGNTLYIIDQSKRLCTYANLPASGAAGGCNTISVPDTNSIGIAFDASGRLLLQTVTNANLYAVTLPGLSASLITALSGGNTATGDLANANVPAPNLSITKTDGLSTVYRGGPVSYTIVASNLGTYAVTGTVTDNVPASVTGVTWTCVASGGSTCTAASGSGNTINTSATLAAGGTATYTVSGTLSAAASGTLTNTANVAVPAWLIDSNIANNTATDSDTINLNANLGITKTDGLANINPGSAITYTIVVSNAGPDASNGSIVTDTVPASITGVTWTCGSATGGATCGAASGSGNAINTTANLPAGSSVTYSVSGTLSVTATGTLSNTAIVITPASGVSDPTDLGRTGAGNNSATDTTTINPVPDLTITKSHSGNFTQGQVGATYTITATNSGLAATSGTVTVTDTLPAGLTATAIAGTGWTCVVGTLTCTRSDALATGASYPVITLTVNVANNAAASVTNSANVSGGGQTNTANDTASNPTTINQLPDLTITKTHTGNFTQGQVGATYSLTATNSGFASTSGTVTVTDTLPVGLTATAISGTGWICVLGTLTCTRGDALAAGASYPVITLTVNVSLTAPATVTNSATVSGGGENNAANNTANDLTTINAAAPPSIGLVKSVGPSGTQIPGTDLLYSVVYTNTGGQPANNFIIVDPNPTNVVPAERVFHNVDFKIGSMTSSPGSTGLVATFEYSNDGGTTWTYTPVSGGGGAPAGYDRAVTNVRWRFTGSLSQTAPDNTGSVSFTVRIR
jgi:uncharacterized repeat protein (TIGR01451 family)